MVACPVTSQVKGYPFEVALPPHGAIAPGADPLTLPRVKIEGGEGLWMFRAIVDGGLDAWRWVDRFMWRLQEAR